MKRIPEFERPLRNPIVAACEDALISALRSLEETQLLLAHVQKHLVSAYKGDVAELLEAGIAIVLNQAALVKEAPTRMK